MKTVALFTLLFFCVVFQTMGQDTGQLSPSGFQDDQGVSSETNAYSSNDQYVVFNNTDDEVDYTTFNMSIPASATITGIIVYVEGKISSGATITMRAQLSWDDGGSYTSTSLGTFSTFTTSDNVYSVGGVSNTFGRTWSPSDFSNANFRVQLDAGGSNGGTLSVDHVQVRVYYTVPPPPGPPADLPVATFEPLSEGSLIIPMNDLDVGSGQATENRAGKQSRLKYAYGLVYSLLANDVTVKWAFSTSKVKDGADFGVSANQVKVRQGDTLITSAFNYKGSVFIVSVQDTAVAGPILRNSTFDKVTVHQVLTAFTAYIPVVYTLDEIPKALIFDNDATQLPALTALFSEAAIPSSAYDAVSTMPASLDAPCYTIAMLPHDEGITSTQINTLHNYLRDGGNLYAQCAAIYELENGPGSTSTYGHTFTSLTPSNAISRSTTTDGNTYVYPDTGARISFGQLVGSIEQSGISHTPYWRLSSGARYSDGFIDIARTNSNFDVTNLYQKVFAKRFDNSAGFGWVVVCGGHNHSGTTSGGVSGGSYQRIPRIALNAFLTPAGRLSCQPLPVELVAFSASARGNSIDLKWKTQTEANNLGFEVQRRSDGGEWTPVGFVQGQGTINTPQNYSFVDVDAMRFGGTIYYRLRQVDRDGGYSFSSTVEVRADGTVAAANISNMSPNPAFATTTLNFSTTTDGPVSISVFDMMGREHVSVTNNMFLTAGSHNQLIDVAGMTPGNYIVVLKTATTVSTSKLVVGR